MSGWRELSRSREGTAAVEFALLLPLLVFLTFGIIDIESRLAAVWDADTYNFQIGDYLSRSGNLQEGDFDEVYAIRSRVMQNIQLDEASISIRLVSIGYDDQQNPVVLWDRKRGPETPSFDLSEASGLATHGQSVLFAITKVNAPAFLTSSGAPKVETTQSTFFRPRITRAIGLNGSLTDGDVAVEGYTEDVSESTGEPE